MATAPSSQPTVPTLSDPPNRAIDSGTAYANKADATMSEIPTTVTGMNSLSSWQNATAQQVYNNALEAANSADNAANSASSAASSTNYAGVWSSLTGSLAAGYSVYHENGLWRSLVAIADITASEPSSTNDDWVFLSGNRWTAQVTASFTAGRNQMIPIYATSAAVDVTQPTFTAGDFLIIHNSQSSTETVRLLNPSNTIVGSSTISAGDNIILAAGDTMHLYARTSTILEVIYG